MTSSEFEKNLEKYAKAVLKVGMNFQPGQRLLIGNPQPGREVPFEAAPLVRHVTREAYQMGARLVDVVWADPELHRLRLTHAAPDSLEEYADYQADGYLNYMQSGAANLIIFAHGTDLFDGMDPDGVSTIQRTARQKAAEATRLRVTGSSNWVCICAPTPGWAAEVFPGLPVEEAVAKLWDAIFKMCRVDQPDPVAAWKDHVAGLIAVKNYLNDKRYTALKYSAPGTDLTVGLPEGHLWASAEFTTDSGIVGVVNMPTEEVFTLPHREKVDGTVKATLPLNHNGALVDEFSLTFENGRVVNTTAGVGDKILQGILDSDEGARRLGEVALVPNSSPISQSGILFYSGLIDENASCHLALGSAYVDSLEGGKTMSNEDFIAAGGNRSLEHVDFMIGSGNMNIDGVLADGSSEPVMRDGEWAFEV